MSMTLTHLTTAEVAGRLGVSQRQVRNMVHHGQLDSYKAGPLLLITSDSLNRALHRPRRTGRAWSTRVVWAALSLLSGGDAPWLESSERYRLKVSLKDRSVDDIMSAARRRASVRIFRATGEVVEQIRVHVAPTGGSALRDDGMSELFGLAPGAGFVDGYVPLGVADEMANAFHLEESAGGNVTLREVEFEGAFRHGVPQATIALDLAEAVSAREQAAGRAVLQRLVDELAAHG